MTGWDQDGSGLPVRRVRGKTLPQEFTRNHVRRYPVRWYKNRAVGWLSPADRSRKEWRYRMRIKATAAEGGGT